MSDIIFYNGRRYPYYITEPSFRGALDYFKFELHANARLTRSMRVEKQELGFDLYLIENESKGVSLVEWEMAHPPFTYLRRIVLFDSECCTYNMSKQVIDKGIKHALMLGNMYEIVANSCSVGFVENPTNEVIYKMFMKYVRMAKND